MLSLFPQLLFLSPFVALLLRLSLALLFGYAAWRHARLSGAMPRTIAAVTAILAVGFLIGLFTQAVALVGAILLIASVVSRRPSLYPISTQLLAIVMCLSLLLSGAGPLAFDLPL